MTKEERQYWKSVIIPTEQERLQKIIDSEVPGLHIKRLSFSQLSRTNGSRSVCLVFKEKFTRYGKKGSTDKINRWASVRKMYDCGGVSVDGITITNVIGRSGVVQTQYHDGISTDEYDTEMMKVCSILSNEYLAWLDCWDWGVFNILKSMNNTTVTQKYCTDAIFARWKRLNVVFDNAYNKYDPNECVANLTSQVARGLITDCPLTNGVFPFDHIPEHELTDAERRWTFMG